MKAKDLKGLGEALKSLEENKNQLNYLKIKPRLVMKDKKIFSPKIRCSINSIASSWEEFNYHYLNVDHKFHSHIKPRSSFLASIVQVLKIQFKINWREVKQFRRFLEGGEPIQRFRDLE